MPRGALDQYDWLVFSSGNGVRYLLDRLLAGGGDLRRLGRIKLAAIGPGTAAELANYRLKADLVPTEYRAERWPRPCSAPGAAGNRFLLARADRGRQVLPSGWRRPAPRWTRWWPIRPSRRPVPTPRSWPRWRQAASTG